MDSITSLCFRPQALVTSSIPAEYIKCESAACSIKGMPILMMMTSVKSIIKIKNLENLGALCRTIPDICRLNKVISRSKDLSRVISHWNCVYSENGRATTPGGLAPSSVEDGARPPSCFCRAIRSPPAYCSIKDEWNEPVR